MKNTLLIIQIIISILLIIVVLLQPKGEGLSQTFGGAGELYKTRRGMEKLLFKLTIVLIVIFIILSLAGFLVK